MHSFQNICKYHGVNGSPFPQSSDIFCVHSNCSRFMNLKCKPVIIYPLDIVHSLGYLLSECSDVKALKQVVEFPLKQG